MPPELIFFAVIIFFSVIDSIARSRKKQQQAAMTAQPETQAEWQLEPEHPTYDADPSYDDAEEEDVPGEPLPRYAEPHGAQERGGGRGAGR